MTTKFYDPEVVLNILSGTINSHTRTAELDSTVDNTLVKRGVWMVFNAAGKLVFSASATGCNGAVLILTNGDSNDGTAFEYEIGGVTRNRMVTYVSMPLVAEVGLVGYDDTTPGDYLPGATGLIPLKVQASTGKLVVGNPATEIITGFSFGVDSSGMLKFTTHGGK